MPMFTTLRIRLPVYPVCVPDRTAFENVAISSSTAWTCSTTSTPSTTSCWSRGIRSATWSTDRCSVTLIFSPANMASIRSRRPAASATATRRRMVSAVSRFFE